MLFILAICRLRASHTNFRFLFVGYDWPMATVLACEGIKDAWKQKHTLSPKKKLNGHVIGMVNIKYFLF